MSDEKDTFWTELAPKFRKALGLDTPSLEEIERTLDRMPQKPMEARRFDRIMARLSGDETRASNDSPLPSWLERESEPEAIDEDLLAALHRNQGDQDPEIEELLEELRKEGLSDDEKNEEH